jgi:hypothetical protein
MSPLTFVSPLPATTHAAAQDEALTTAAITGSATTAVVPTATAVVPPLDRSSYALPVSLPSGLYYWRVAAVDSEGNVGAYSQPRPILIAAGAHRLFLPQLSRNLSRP